VHKAHFFFIRSLWRALFFIYACTFPGVLFISILKWKSKRQRLFFLRVPPIQAEKKRGRRTHKQQTLLQVTHYTEFKAIKSVEKFLAPGLTPVPHTWGHLTNPRYQNF